VERCRFSKLSRTDTVSVPKVYELYTPTDERLVSIERINGANFTSTTSTSSGADPRTHILYIQPDDAGDADADVKVVYDVMPGNSQPESVIARFRIKFKRVS